MTTKTEKPYRTGDGRRFATASEALAHCDHVHATSGTVIGAEHAPTVPALPVIFRKHYERGGLGWEVTAAFPTLPSDSSDWYNFTVYAHVGQHGSASPDWFRKGRLASPAEYADLLAELRGIYENPHDDPVRLVIYRKETRQHRDARKAEWQAMRDNVRAYQTANPPSAA